MVYAGCHVGTDVCRYLLGNRLLHQCRRDRFYDSAAAVLDLRHQMRLIVVSSIDNRTHCIDLLDHGQCISLSESRACKLRFSHGIAGMDHTTSLIRKIDTGSCSEIENALRLKEIIFSHLCCDLHHTIVAGIGNDIGKSFCPVSIRPYRTFDESSRTFRSKRLSAVTDKIIALGNRSHFKCGAHNDRLYNRSRLVGICHAEITPHSVQRIYGFLIVHGIDLPLGIHV